MGEMKVLHFIRPAGGGGFIFAGLIDHWIGADGELDTCTVVTTEANDLMRPLHDRMPVILDPQAATTWLDPENRHPEDLLKPFSPDAMEAWQVGSAVGNVRNDFPELIEPV